MIKEIKDEREKVGVAFSKLPNNQTFVHKGKVFIKFEHRVMGFNLVHNAICLNTKKPTVNGYQFTASTKVEPCDIKISIVHQESEE